MILRVQVRSAFGAAQARPAAGARNLVRLARAALGGWVLLVGCSKAESERTPSFAVDAFGRGGQSSLDAAEPAGTAGALDASRGAAGAPEVKTGAPDGHECFTHPTTHLGIINACTDAVKVDKSSNLEGLLADGGLPPLP